MYTVAELPLQPTKGLSVLLLGDVCVSLIRGVVGIALHGRASLLAFQTFSFLKLAVAAIKV